MKIKSTVIDKLNILTSVEMDLFLYLAKHQDDAGNVYAVHNKVVCDSTGMCKQSFYTALYGLEKKKIITYIKASDIDYDVKILDNDFSKANSFTAGCDSFIDLQRAVFHQPAFKKLSAKEKWMLLYFLRCTNENTTSYKIGTQKFYEKFCAILRVSKRMIRAYLHQMREFFSVGIKKGNYYITYKRSVFASRYDNSASENDNFVNSMVRRFRIKKHSPKAISDVSGLIKQYGSKAKKKGLDIYKLIQNTMLQSIQLTIPPKERKLNPKYIHKLLRQELETI